MGIETQNISTLAQQEGIEEIRWRVLEMRKVIGMSNKVILQECWLTTSRPFFSSSESNGYQEVLSCVPTIIDENMNHMLSQEFSEQEVAIALKQMAPSRFLVPMECHHFFTSTSGA